MQAGGASERRREGGATRDFFSSSHVRENSLWSHGEWRSWEEIERLVKKSSLGEVETGHVWEACNWAREHRPIPVDFATFLQSHMTLDDIKRVVARREKEGQKKI